MKKTLLKIIGVLTILLIVFILTIKIFLPNIDLKEVNVEVTPERIERGRYLANHVMLCMDCHAERQWNLYAGPPKNSTLGVGGEVFDENLGFPGKYVSPNLTPHNLTNWTDAEIYRAITSGETKDEKAIFPVMPYYLYGQLDDEDIYSVIAYLRTLKPVKSEKIESSSNFPMNIIINTIPHVNTPSKRPKKGVTVEYGKYIATAAACVECHTPFVKGELITDKAYGGGRWFIFPNGDTLYSKNITMHKDGIAHWNEDNFVSKFKSFDIENGYEYREVTLDKQTIMPWTMYAGMDTTDLKALYAYLQSVNPVPGKY